MTIHVVIQTARSALTTQQLPNGMEILDACVLDVSNKLHIRPEIKLYGKTVHQNRDVGFFSDTSIGYRYSGQLARSQPLTPALSGLLQNVNTLYNASFNGILVNRYQDGNNYIGSHSDDEAGLDKTGVVAVSHGAVRKFRIRDKKTKAIVEDVLMEPGMILCMSGRFQEEFTHEVPVEKRVKTPRYSFTFRHHTI